MARSAVPTNLVGHTLLPDVTCQERSEQPSTFHKDFPQVHSELAWLNQPSGDASRASASAFLRDAGHDCPSPNSSWGPALFCPGLGVNTALASQGAGELETA